VWKPWAFIQASCPAKSDGDTVSARVIAGKPGVSRSIRWYIKIGRETRREGGLKGTCSTLICPSLGKARNRRNRWLGFSTV
jgi:hypothetical protein